MIQDDLERASKPMPIVDLERCDGCGLCVRVCASGALAIRSGKAVVARPEACTYAGSCERICPVHAICLPMEIVFDEKRERCSIGEPIGSRRETE